MCSNLCMILRWFVSRIYRKTTAYSHVLRLENTLNSQRHVSCFMNMLAVVFRGTQTGLSSSSPHKHNYLGSAHIQWLCQKSH